MSQLVLAHVPILVHKTSGIRTLILVSFLSLDFKFDKLSLLCIFIYKISKKYKQP